MGRKSKSKDRGYLTATEWKEEGGGFKKVRVIADSWLPQSLHTVHPPQRLYGLSRLDPML